MLDFDYRVSLAFNLPYKSYTNSDKEALELLGVIKDSRDFSLEWNKNMKRYDFIVYDEDGLCGSLFSGKTMSEAIVSYFKKVINH